MEPIDTGILQGQGADAGLLEWLASKPGIGARAAALALASDGKADLALWLLPALMADGVKVKAALDAAEAAVRNLPEPSWRGNAAREALGLAGRWIDAAYVPGGGRLHEPAAVRKMWKDACDTVSTLVGAAGLVDKVVDGAQSLAARSAYHAILAVCGSGMHRRSADLGQAGEEAMARIRAELAANTAKALQCAARSAGALNGAPDGSMDASSVSALLEACAALLGVPAEKPEDERSGDILEFRGEHLYLSNFWGCKVVFEGDEYPSTENAYQAAKFEKGRRAPFFGCKASEAKKLGKAPGALPGWESRKVAVMASLLGQKFAPGTELGERLKATSGRIVEGNDWGDVFWGVCGGKGMNMLGRLLEARRGALLKAQKERT
jgi:predicted NAD-dependent protein-ADP-ribosyltransferase YbiA (DUF1768 family)